MPALHRRWTTADVRSRVWWAALAVSLLATSIAYFVWPIRHALGDVVLGSALFAPDAVLNIGVLEWGYASLRSPNLQLFEWTAGFPLHNTLSATENLVGWQLFYSPLRWASLGPVAAYNVLLFSTIPVSGLTAAMLARQLGASRAGGFVAGFVFAFSPFHISQMVHLQIMAVCWAPLPFFFFDRTLQRESWRETAGLALSFVLVFASSVYMGVFVAIGLLLWLPAATIAGRWRPSVRPLARLAAAALVVVVALSPLLSHYWRFKAENRVQPSESLLEQRSMGLEEFVRTPGWQWVTSRAGGEARVQGADPDTSRRLMGTRRTPQHPRAAFPGVVAAGLLLSWFAFRRRTPKLAAAGTMLWLLVAAVALLSLGPVLKIHADYPARFLAWVPLPGRIWHAVPGIRNVWKFHILAVLFGSLLCGLGATALLARATAQRSMMIFAGLVGLLVAENWPAGWFMTASHALRAPLELSDAYPLLQREGSAGGVVELPIADATGDQTPMLTRYAYASAGHLRRVVAIHGTARLPVTDALLHAADSLPDARHHATLIAAGVTRLVVHRSLMPAGAGDRLVARLGAAGYRIIFTGTQAVVFELR